MKNFVAALALAVVGISAHATVITEYQSSSAFPSQFSTNNLSADSFSQSGRTTGGGGNGLNVTYTFVDNTEYVWFNFTATNFDKLYVHVTAADNTAADFNRTVTSGSMFWGFAVTDSDIAKVNFSTRASTANSNVNNDTITVSSISGYVQPTTPTTPTAEVPEPGTVAILGLGLMGFAVARRKAAKNKNA